MDISPTSAFKTTELWMTTGTALVSTILATTAPNSTTITLIVCLSVTATAYLICRTTFKIARLKYQPETAWAAKGLRKASSKELLEERWAIEPEEDEYGQDDSSS